MSKPLNLSGMRFGKLKVISYAERDEKGRICWLCKCDCGKELLASTHDLRRGHKKSCGCARRPHGFSQTSEYKSYMKMMNRCFNPNHDKYQYYGGRGITVCERWKNSLEAFMKDMGPKPSREYTLDRIDPDGNYEPGNCRWADKYTQARNKRVQSNSKTGITGVTPTKGGYVASLRQYGNLIYLGTFKTIKEAETARKEAELKYWEGDDANEIHTP